MTAVRSHGISLQMLLPEDSLLKKIMMHVLQIQVCFGWLFMWYVVPVCDICGSSYVWFIWYLYVAYVRMWYMFSVCDMYGACGVFDV